MATEIRTPEDLTLKIYEYIKDLVLNGIKNNTLRIDLDTNLYMIENSIFVNMIDKIYAENISTMFLYTYRTSGRYNEDRTFIYATRVIFDYYSYTEEQRTLDKKTISDFVDDIKNKINYSKSTLDKIIFIRDYFKLNGYIVQTSSTNQYIAKAITMKASNITGYSNLIYHLLTQLNIPYVITKINDIVSGFMYLENGDYCHVVIPNDLNEDINLCLKSDEYISTNYSTNFSSKIIGANFEEEISATNNKFDFYID